MDGEARAGGSKHPQQLIFENVSPATRLLEKRRQMYEVQDALENQKVQFAKNEEAFKRKEEQLRTKDQQLQHQLFRFSKFLQDNEAKRKRAENRANDEKAQIAQKDDEIRYLEKQLESSRRQCSELDEEVSRNMKYETFLERVKNTCEDYAEIQDLVTRYVTLETANKDLMKLQSDCENVIEEQRTEFQAYRKEQEMEMLAFTNRINSLQSELEEVQKNRQRLEHQADEATQEDSRQSLHFGQILMSVENLFERCKEQWGSHPSLLEFLSELREKEAKGNEGDREAEFRANKNMAIRELRVIQDYLKDFATITEVLKKERRHETTKVRQQFPEAAKMPEPTFERVDPGADTTGGSQRGSQGLAGPRGAE